MVDPAMADPSILSQLASSCLLHTRDEEKNFFKVIINMDICN